MEAIKEKKEIIRHSRWCKIFFANRGYGFSSMDNTQQTIHVHISDIILSTFASEIDPGQKLIQDRSSIRMFSKIAESCQGTQDL